MFLKKYNKCNIKKFDIWKGQNITKAHQGIQDYSGPPHDPEAEYPLTAWQPHNVYHVSLFGGHHDVCTVVTPVGHGASALPMVKIEIVKQMSINSFFIIDAIKDYFPTLFRFRIPGLIYYKHNK